MSGTWVSPSPRRPANVAVPRTTMEVGTYTANLFLSATKSDGNAASCRFVQKNPCDAHEVVFNYRLRAEDGPDKQQANGSWCCA